MRPVIIIHGRHANRRGTIAGPLTPRNRHATKAIVRFSADEWSTFDLDNLATPPVEDQGELGI